MNLRCQSLGCRIKIKKAFIVNALGDKHPVKTGNFFDSLELNKHWSTPQLLLLGA